MKLQSQSANPAIMLGFMSTGLDAVILFVLWRAPRLAWLAVPALLAVQVAIVLFYAKVFSAHRDSFNEEQMEIHHSFALIMATTAFYTGAIALMIAAVVAEGGR